MSRKSKTPSYVAVGPGGGLFPPLWMGVPKPFIHLREFKPGIDENPVFVTKINEIFVVEIPFAIIGSPRGRINNLDSEASPGSHQALDRNAGTYSRVEINFHLWPASSGLEVKLGPKNLEQVGITVDA